ncbi:hypothetical protein JVU11DRAFT_2943 [Chiua virens]|nr:hypothetical protein JVU11DRAFT_2943 [Chiua virens]
MVSPLFTLVYFVPLALAAPTNSTTAACPSCDASHHVTVCNQRSVVVLLTSCGLTLLICVWHAIHPPLPLPCWKWYRILKSRFRFMLVTFITPEVTIASAIEEWCKVKRVTKDARDSGCEWWTGTHSHFVLNGGFVLCDGTGLREIKVDEFLQLWSAKELINPMITEAEIEDRSSSNGLAKALLFIQLSWFMIQVLVRVVYQFVVTLIELDTVCMAFLTLPLIFCWWKKPFCAARPHIFYKRDATGHSSPEVLTKANDSQQLPPEEFVTITSERDDDDFLFPTAGSSFVPLCVTWVIFGALHLVAWDYEFPTVPEKFLWRMASLALAASPIVYLLPVIMRNGREDTKILCLIFVMLIGITSRLLLVAIMLASLRSLPSSAYQIPPWTTYIPHL